MAGDDRKKPFFAKLGEATPHKSGCYPAEDAAEMPSVNTPEELAAHETIPRTGEEQT